MAYKCTEEQFLRDVAEHQLTVIRDDGVHRHLQFRRPGTVCHGFDLITWPGYLCFCGDMGTYVFQRLHDMFAFFRVVYPGHSDGLHINPGYWSEKCEAVDRRSGGVEEYSPDRFREAVLGYLEDAGDDYPDLDLEELREEVASEVLAYADEGEHAARLRVEDFEFEGFTFGDFWERDLSEYTFRFIWCCYALAWGVRQYDQAKASR